jgi:hypothetical protein
LSTCPQPYWLAGSMLLVGLLEGLAGSSFALLAGSLFVCLNVETGALARFLTGLLDGSIVCMLASCLHPSSTCQRPSGFGCLSIFGPHHWCVYKQLHGTASLQPSCSHTEHHMQPAFYQLTGLGIFMGSLCTAVRYVQRLLQSTLRRVQFSRRTWFLRLS